MIVKTIIQVDADTGGAVAGIKRLVIEEDKAAAARKKHSKEGSDGLESYVKNLTKAGLGVAAFAQAAKFAFDTINLATSQSKLQFANLNIDIERVSKSALGLKDRMQLLRETAQLNSGTWKLTSGELAKAQGAMRALELRGVDAAEATKAITDAVVELNTNGLQNLGIALDATKHDLSTASGRMAAFADAMSVVNGLADESAKTGLLVGESWKQAAIKAEDAWTDFKTSFVTGNFDIAKSAAEMKRLGYLPDVDMSDWKAIRGRTSLLESGYDEDKMATAVRTMDALGKLSATLVRDAKVVKDRRVAELWAGIADDITGAASAASKVRGGSRTRGEETERYSWDASEAVKRDDKFDPDVLGPSLGSTPYDDISSTINVAQFGNANRSREYADFNQRQSESKLEGIFGPLSDFDAYKTAFETLSGAVGASYGAWIDGSMSAGQAFKKFVADALKSVAVQMAMESIKHAAYAIGSLAFGNVAGAATHAKAAAMFGAGAIAVGVAAKGLHGGGGGSPSTGATAPGGGVPSYSGGQQQGGGGNTIVIAYGENYSQDSARQRQLRAGRILDDARQAAPNSGVSYA